MDPTKPPGIRFEQIFLRTAHFSHREDALMLPPTTAHPLEARVNLRLNYYEGVRGSAGVGVTVSTDPSDARLLYQFEVEMIALVAAEAGQENMPPADYVKGPAILTLIPFIRETVANITVRGRFGPIWLSPMNIQQFLLEQSAEITAAKGVAANKVAKRTAQHSKHAARR